MQKSAQDFKICHGRFPSCPSRFTIGALQSELLSECSRVCTYPERGFAHVRGTMALGDCDDRYGDYGSSHRQRYDQVLRI